jgi:hypothetical protein
MLRDLFNANVDLLLDLAFFLDNLLKILGEVELLLEHLLSGILIGLLPGWLTKSVLQAC